MSYLLKGGTIVTFVQGNNARAFKADVLIDDSTITKISDNIPAPAGVEVIDCTDKWITPGMVDTHRHTFLTVLRGDHDDWLLTEYLVKNSWHTQPDLSPSEIRIGELAGCLDALQSGVTTILDHFHAATTPEHADAALEAAIQSGARVVFSPARHSAPTKILPKLEFGKEPEMGKWQLEKFKEYGKRDNGKLTRDGRVTLGFAYDFVGFGPIEWHQEVLKAARAFPAAIITAHVVGGPQVKVWRDGGLLGPDVVFSHCNALGPPTKSNDELWEVLKEHKCGIASTPFDELGMAMSDPTALVAVEKGVKSGLGVDTTSINGGDLFAQMRILLQHDRAKRHAETEKTGVVPPKHNKYNATDVFRLATLGGAEVLNLSHTIGTVEEGKKADLLIFDANSCNLAGIDDPYAGIVFHASNADIELVMVNGEILKKGGKFTRIDWPVVAKELKAAATGVRKRWPSEKLEAIWSEYHTASNGGPKF